MVSNSNSNVVTTILQSEVRTIPLLFISVSDPIGSGFVKDLARPGGNVTGFANFQPTPGVVAKRCEFAAQMVCADAGLHADQTRRQVGEPYFYLAAGPLLAQYDRATSIQAHDVKRVFADIDTYHGDFTIKLG
jgi:hypothetical protein